MEPLSTKSLEAIRLTDQVHHRAQPFAWHSAINWTEDQSDSDNMYLRPGVATVLDSLLGMMTHAGAEVTQSDNDKYLDGGTPRYRNHRKELLDKLVDYLVDHGLSEASVDTWGPAIGTSGDTLQHHFGTTDELLGEVFSTLRARENIRAPASVEDAEQLMRDLWRRWSNPQRTSHFRLLFEVFGHALRDPGHYSAFLDGVVSDWITVIEFFAVQLGYTPKDATLVATSVLAQLRGLQLDLLATGDYERTAAALDMFIAQFTRAAPISNG